MKLYLFIIIFITGQVAFAQKADFSLAEKLLDGGDIPAAAEEFEKVVSQNPDDAEAAMLLGYCYVNLPNMHHKAVPILENSLKIFTDAKSSKGIIDASFLLGIAYRKTMQFDKAADIFNNLIINKEFADYKSIDILEREINYTLNAKKNYSAKDLIRVRNMGSNVNSDFTDHSPVYIVGSNLFMFSSRKDAGAKNKKNFDGQFNDNIFFGKFKDYKTDSLELLKDFDPKKSFAICWLSNSANKMLLHFDGNIYFTEKNGEKWQEPQSFKEINTIYRESDACMSEDGNNVYFVSDKPDGEGGLDLYRISRENGGKWSKPENLGNKINTQFDDNSPFLHTDGTLYFAWKDTILLADTIFFTPKLKEKRNFLTL